MRNQHACVCAYLFSYEREREGERERAEEKKRADDVLVFKNSECHVKLAV